MPSRHEIDLQGVDMTTHEEIYHSLQSLWRAMNEHDRCAVIADPALQDCPIIMVTRGFTRHTLYSEDDVVGRNCRFLQGPQTDGAVRTALGDALALCRRVTVQIWNYRKDGTGFLNRLEIKPLFSPDGKVANFVGVQSVIEGTWQDQQVLDV